MKRFASILFLILFLTPSISADIYKYQDDNGVWHFSQTPPSDSKVETEVFTESGAKRSSPINAKELFKNFKGVNDPRSATYCVVMVESGFGKGSGFFINNSGYIVTNRHVIRGDKKRQQRIDKGFDDYDKRFETAGKNLKKQAESLENYKKRIDNFKNRVDSMREGSSKEYELKRYNSALKDYKIRKKSYEKNRSDYLKQKKDYENKRSGYKSRVSVAALDRSFKITLKDKRQFYAYLVQISSDYDLALLKLDDNYKTPFLVPDNNPVQGNNVYAIGSPIGLQDTLSKGIVSGFERGMIKTDAKIYPGNSGGPLVNESGRIIGINTLKKITRKFEGLGFAIPVYAVYNEFSDSLN
jgi:S1-C subfamily serine protease